MNKRIMLLLSCSIPLGSLLGMSGEPPKERISNERINNVKVELVRQEREVNAARSVAFTAVIAGACYLTYKWLVAKDEIRDPNRPTDDFIKELRNAAGAHGIAEFMKKYKEDLQRQEAANNDPWFRKAGRWIKDRAIRTLHDIPHAFWLIAVPTPFTIIRNTIPGVSIISDYMFTPRTIQWFIIRRTSFTPCAHDIKKWVQRSMAAKQGELTDTTFKELETIVNMFVNQVEKVLGFMSYIKDKVPAALKAEHDRGDLISKKIKEVTDQFCQAADKVIFHAESNEKKHIRTMDSLFDYMILDMSDQIESFKNIEKSIGLEDIVVVDPFASLGPLVQLLS
jgi:hypothetical protein